REFIGFIVGAAMAWPRAAVAQQPAMPVIEFLSPASPDANVVDRLRGFRQGLKDSGYVDGENVTIMYRWAEGQFDRLPALATELLHRGVAVIAANSNAAAVAAQAATKTMGEWLSERLGQQFIIENRPGAGGNIGAETAVRAPADGYTLLYVVTANAIS